MQIEQLTKIDQIKEGDLLLISDGNEITHAKAQKVKVTEHDGTEVIFNMRKNKYFNVGMYLNGESWVKDVCIVRNSAGVGVALAARRREALTESGGEPTCTCLAVHPYYCQVHAA